MSSGKILVFYPTSEINIQNVQGNAQTENYRDCHPCMAWSLWEIIGN